jgi:alpha-D-xyloside xylohydrolase
LEARCREIIGWRMQLVPYLAAAFQRYSTDGTPPFRALVLDSPHDKHLYLVDDQYLVGDRMMVAPLFAGEPSRKIVLPEGRWHDFWTGEMMEGGNELAVSASTERIPVYVKSGSIVPWADAGLFAGARETRRVTARVYGDGSLPFELASGNESLQLSFSQGRKSAEGTKGFEVYAWQKIG